MGGRVGPTAIGGRRGGVASSGLKRSSSIPVVALWVGRGVGPIAVASSSRVEAHALGRMGGEGEREGKEGRERGKGEKEGREGRERERERGKGEREGREGRERERERGKGEREGREGRESKINHITLSV